MGILQYGSCTISVIFIDCYKHTHCGPTSRGTGREAKQLLIRSLAPPCPLHLLYPLTVMWPKIRDILQLLKQTLTARNWAFRLLLNFNSLLMSVI